MSLLWSSEEIWISDRRTRAPQRPPRISRADSGKETKIKNFFALCLNYPQTIFRPINLVRTEIWQNVQCFTSQTFKKFFSFRWLPSVGRGEAVLSLLEAAVCVCIFIITAKSSDAVVSREPHVLHKTNFIFTLFTRRRGTGWTVMMEELPQGSSFASPLHIALNDI